mgnify:CR=1 FL=1
MSARARLAAGLLWLARMINPPRVVSVTELSRRAVPPGQMARP